MTGTTTSSENHTAADRVIPELTQTVQTLLRLPPKEDERLLLGFQAIIDCFDSPFGILQFESQTQTVEHTGGKSDSHGGAWRKLSDGLLLNARYRNQGCGQLFRTETCTPSFAVMATPLNRGGGETFGSLSIVTKCVDASALAWQLAELEALAALLTNLPTASAPLAANGSIGAPSTPTASTGVSKAAEYESLQEFAFAVVNNLKGKMNCDQVAFGLIRGKHVQVLCLSGFDHIYPRSPGVRVLEQAMSECLDAKRPICSQHDNKYGTEPIASGHALHRVWRADVGGVPVASVPVLVKDGCVAVLSLRNPPDRLFTNEQLQKVMDLVNPLAPGIQLLARADRSLRRHIADNVKSLCRGAVARNQRTMQACAIALSFLIAYGTFAHRPYILTVPCQTIPADLRRISTPFAGTIEAVHVRSGQFVRQGELLAVMETKPLQVERDRELASLRLAMIEMNEATRNNNANKASQAQARAEIARSQLALLDLRLASAQITASADGVVVGEHLERRKGEVVPLGDALCDIATEGRLTLEVQIPERLIPHAQTGQAVVFALEARPDDRQQCNLTWLAETALASQGQNAFLGECQLPSTATWLKAGMTGTARINTGPRRVAWLYFHRLVDWMRMQAWKL